MATEMAFTGGPHDAEAIRLSSTPTILHMARRPFGRSTKSFECADKDTGVSGLPRPGWAVYELRVDKENLYHYVHVGWNSF